MKDKRLEEMKHDYDTIAIPPELRERITETIKAAKEELPPQNVTTKHHTSILRWVKRTAGVAIAAMLTITVLANSGENIAYAMGQVPVLGAIAKIVTFREYKNTNNNMEADIKVPAVSVEDGDGNALYDPTARLNQSIEDYTSSIIAAFEADLETSGGENHQSVDLNYDIVTDSESLFSLRFNELTVMASGAESVKIYTLDKLTGTVISIGGLFQVGSDYLNRISDNIKAQMRAQMAADENKSYFLDDDMPESDFTAITEDADFYVNEAGRLVIAFDEYEVSPGYMGSVEFEIPTDVLSDIAKDGYLK